MLSVVMLKRVYVKCSVLYFILIYEVLAVADKCLIILI
jgi:hypothetical protein